MEMSDRVAFQDGWKLSVRAVNSEQHREPKNASRNMDSKTVSMNEDRRLVQRVRMQQARKSAVRGKRFGEVYGSASQRP